MSFLFPLYLLGAAALAVPILLHLRRRPPKEHIPFSSHMFLEQTPEKLTRRTRLERWLLLALRCLALLLLAFAFGRPFLNTLPEAIVADSLERKVILIDRSASMKREDLWDQALKAAKDQIKKTNTAAEVTVAFFDNEFEEIASLSAWAPLSPG
ncbi:MAG: BatA domain-containing protein, partial [Verrucomicrobiales bacterium]|nr:BatA domain-containing protein [Verrucomicrobiales bacterium]